MNTNFDPGTPGPIGNVANDPHMESVILWYRGKSLGTLAQFAAFRALIEQIASDCPCDNDGMGCPCEDLAMAALRTNPDTSA